MLTLLLGSGMKQIGSLQTANASRHTEVQECDMMNIMF